VGAGGSNIEFGRLSKLNCLGRSKLRPGSANLNFPASSNYPVHQGGAFFKASQVAQKMAGDGFFFVSLAAGDVGRDEAARGVAEGVIVRERFGFGDVQPGGSEVPGDECLGQGTLVHGGAAADVVEGRAGFHRSEAFGVEKVVGLFAGGEDVDHMVGGGQGLGEAGGGDRRHALVATRMAAVGDDVWLERGEELDEFAGDGAIAHDEDRAPLQ